MTSTVSGKIGEVIFHRFEPGEDLRRGLLAVIKEKGIKSGIILSIAGGLEYATLHRPSAVGKPGIPPETIIDIPIDITIVGGRIVYQKKADS